MPNIKDQELALLTTKRAKPGASCRWCSALVEAWDCCQSFGRFGPDVRTWYCCPECGESQMTRAEGSAAQRRMNTITTITVFLTVIVSATFDELDLYQNWLMHLLNNLQSR